MQYVDKNNTSWTFDCNVFSGTGDLSLVVYNTDTRQTQSITLSTYVYENNTVSFTQAVALEEGVRYEFRIEAENKRLVYAAVTVEGDASVFNSPTTEEVTFV
jgi:hypothetical protein